MKLDVDIGVHLTEFGTDAVYTNAAGVLKSIKVVFSPESYVEGRVLNTSAVTSAIIAVAKSSDVPSADNRCKLKVGATTYNVVDGKAYGDGWTILTLRLD